MILLSIIIPFFTLLINRQQLFLYSPKDVHPSRLTRVFDTCAYIEISTSLENRAFFIEKMSNFPQSLVRNFA